MSDSIDILCSIDHRFEMQLFVTLCSLFESNPQEHFHVHLITTDVTVEQQEEIRRWVAQQGQHITLYTIPEELQNNDLLPKEGRFPISSYMRCFVAEMLPKELHRILYLDCDILVCASVADLWKTDLTGHALAAVDDMWALKGNAERLGYDVKYSYFNSGVLLINLDEWRRVDTYHQALAFIQTHAQVLQFPDQDVLNGLFHASRIALHPRYNMQDNFFRNNRKHIPADVQQQVEESLNAPTIVHFTCTHKPWDYKCYHPWRSIYLKTIEKTPFRGFKLPKGKFSDRLEVPVNRCLWTLKLIKPKYRQVSTPNSQLPTPNAQRSTLNAQRESPSAWAGQLSTLKALITGIILLALGIWCASRWDVWFHNPEEAPYEASDVPARVLLTFGDDVGLHSRNVSWMCGDTVADSYVELLDVADSTASKEVAVGEVFESRSGKAAYYVALLRGLKSGHAYRYRVSTAEKKSQWHSFQMPLANQKEVSFIYTGDIQDTIGGITNQLLKKAFRTHPDAEFFVCGGDLTERPTDAFWGETFQTLDSIGQSVPVLTVTGNHDYLKGVICTLERRFSLIHSYYLDSMVGENQVFTVRYGDLQIFCLDSNREFFYLWTQRRWLEEQLSTSTAKWKIVVSHHPFYSVKGRANNLIQRWMFDDLIREYGVQLVLQGHEHAYARCTMQQSTTYLISHCSPKGYEIDPPEGRFEKVVRDIRTYQTVRINDNTLVIKTFDAVKGIPIDSLCISR